MGYMPTYDGYYGHVKATAVQSAIHKDIDEHKFHGTSPLLNVDVMLHT